MGARVHSLDGAEYDVVVDAAGTQGSLDLAIERVRLIPDGGPPAVIPVALRASVGGAGDTTGEAMGQQPVK